MAAETLTLAQAASLLRPGMTVFIHGTATEPRAIVEYIAAHPHHLAGVHLVTSFIPGINTVVLADAAPGARLTTFMAQPALADAIAAGHAEALRLAYSRVPGYLDALPAIDLAFVHGRTLDDGSVSTGVSGELIPTACAKADRVCLLDNPDMPVPQRGCMLAPERIDYRVSASASLIEYRAADRADAVSEAIARHVAGLVRDGDTVQSGLGVIPNAVFANEPLRRFLQELYTTPGHSDDFRRLERLLYIVATNLDTGRPVVFGKPGYQDVPISSAVQASTALPGLFPPVEIDGDYYVDGGLLRTLHASVALDTDIELLFCLNPIVPFDEVAGA